MGALQMRQGTTFAVSGGAALSETTIISFNGVTGGGFYRGTLAITSGATFIGPVIDSIYEFTNLSGASFLIFSGIGGFTYNSASLWYASPSFMLNQLYYATGNTLAGYNFNYLLDPAGLAITSTVFPGMGQNYPLAPIWNFTTFVNRLWMCNGDHFYKWDGYTANAAYTAFSLIGGVTTYQQYFASVPSVYKYCLPPPGYTLFSSVDYGLLTTQMIAGGTITTGAGLFTSATYTYSVGFINEAAFSGPVTNPLVVNLSLSGGYTTGPGGTSCGLYAENILLFGFSSGQNTGQAGFTVPDGYGIGLTLFKNYQGIEGGGGSYLQLQKVVVYRDNGSGTGRYLLGYASPPGVSGATTFPFGFAAPFNDFGYTLPTTTPEPTCIYATLPPQFLEIYNNQMFMCGFSQALSTVQFSDIGQPESIQPENNFDFRTNDGDYLTGMKAAFQQLFLFKTKSFAALSGTDPTNFALTPISDQYGCLSHRAIATYQSYLMFLDKKGIVLFNGAIPTIASTKLDPIFATMNIQAAINQAWMVHNKERNQIWCGIPVNGSTLINQIIVYDYLLNAWTHFDGFNTPCATIAFANNPHSTVYFGGYTSALGFYGTSINGDCFSTSNIITAYAQSQFFSEEGQSVEKQFRRLFLNTISANGFTNLWNIALYADYSSLPSMTTIMGSVLFQNRIDFGIPAKALSVYFSTASNSDRLTFQGFSIEHRFQRNQ